MMREINYSVENKQKLFDFIRDNYFEQNFSTLSKSEFELFLFKFHYDVLRSGGLSIDDYSISNDLGITQNRVRSLKERMALRFGNDYEWVEDFKSLLKYAKYDEVKHLIKLNIPNVNTIIELRNYLESMHLYDEYQLNPKLFQCKAGVFLEIIESLFPNEDLGEVSMNELELYVEKEKIPTTAIYKIKNGNVKEGVIEILNNCGKEIVMEILNMFPGGSVLKNIISNVF